MSDSLKRDLRFAFAEERGAAPPTGPAVLDTVQGRDNLAQALMLRLLVARGELEALGHPRYGSRIAELIGQPLDAPNLELLRRYVRQALLQDPRVDDVTRVEVHPRRDEPGAVTVVATVSVVEGEPLGIRVELDVT